jgi:HK97 family phage prohead protease
MSQQIERRALEIRAADDGSFSIVGRAVRYGALSQDLGGFVEQIAPGAFTESLADGDQKLYWGHDMTQPLARRSNGSLEIVDSPTELRFRAKLDPQVAAHHDYYSMCKSGLCREMSFAFMCKPENQSWDKTKTPVLRTIRKAELFEISMVMEPAYAGSTSAEARARAAVNKAAGLNEAVALLRRANRALAQARIDAIKRDANPYPDAYPDMFRCLEGHMRCIGEACELAYAIGDTVSDILDSVDDENDDRSRRDATAMDEVFRKAHAAAHRCMELACTSHAERQMVLAKWAQSAVKK